MTDLSSKLQMHLAKIGREAKLFGPSSSQDELNAALHKLFVFDIAASFFGKQKEAGLEVVRNTIAQEARDRITEAVHLTSIEAIGRATIIADSADYTFSLQTKRPSKKLDQTKLRVEMLKHLKPEIVEAIISAATTRNAPAKEFKVMEKEA